jgi:hypothetical protein
MPLRGWHAQQIRRLAMARHVEADMLLSVDSDVVLVRPSIPKKCGATAGCACFASMPAPATPPRPSDWLAHAGRSARSAETIEPAPDYINMVAWRMDTARALLDHIEKTTGKGWIRAVISSREISECMIYGRFADEVLGGAGHRPSGGRCPHALVQRDLSANQLEGLAHVHAGSARSGRRRRAVLCPSIRDPAAGVPVTALSSFRSGACPGFLGIGQIGRFLIERSA